MKNLFRVPTKNFVLGLLFFFFSCSQNELLNDDSLKKSSESLARKISLQALPHTKQYSADVATAWFNELTEITRTKPYFVGQANRIFAYSGIALYESVVPGMPSYQSIYKHLTGNIIESEKKKDYYWPACANAAIARISSRIMQTYPAPNLALVQVQALEASFNNSFQSQVTPEQLQVSNEFGKYVADIIFEWSKTDGVFNPNGTPAICPTYIPLGGLGNWVPTPPAFLPAVGQCYPKTFVPNIGNTVLAAPHPAYSVDISSAFYQAANEVYQRRNNITPEEIKAFSNWRDLSPNYNPIAHILKISTHIFIKEQLNLEDASALYAKQTIAAYDAASALFQSKFHYALIRPVTYIRGVMGHSTWLSYGTTPQTPSYTDELAVTASAVEILEKYFGTNYAVTDSVHQSTHGIFSYPSLNALVLDVVEARVSGGTCFRFAGEEGIIQGRKVGLLINALPFKKP